MSYRDVKQCPRCGVTLPLLALSRRDNVTMICDACGQDEALVDIAMYYVWDVPEASMKRERTLAKHIRENGGEVESGPCKSE